MNQIENLKENIGRIKEKIWHLIEKHQFGLFLIIITTISLILRISLLDGVSGDYTIFLKGWFDELKANRWTTSIRARNRKLQCTIYDNISLVNIFTFTITIFNKNGIYNM